MRAGDLNQRVVLERRIQSQDSSGEPINTWLPVGTFWAAVEPLRGREFIAAAAVASEITARIRLRYVPGGVTSAMRVVHGADVYDIQTAIHVKSGRRELQLMCRIVA